jgi:hypothetical protein
VPNSATAAPPCAIAPAATVTNGPARRAPRSCSARATVSLPVPASPTTSTPVSCAAIFSICARSAWIALPEPTRSPGAGICRRRPSFSRRSWPASTAWPTTRRSLASDSGFSMKSHAPSRVASTAVSMLPWPEIMMTGHGRPPRSLHSRSRLMPSRSGIQMSSRIASGRWRRRASRAAAADSATSTA